MRLPKTLLFLFLLLVIATAYAQKKTRVIVVDITTFQPLPAVFVQVKNTSRFILVDTTGIFNINSKQNDTLVFSHVGYEKLVIPLLFEEDAILVRMKEKATVLDEVIISSRKLYLSEINPRKSTIPHTFTLAGSISAPWDYFNKREKEKRKVAQLMEENDRIRTFIEVITDPTVKEELMQDYNISEIRYYEILVKFNKQNFEVIYSSDADAIIKQLQDYFSKNKP
jgi:hypothetical protein